MAFKDKVASVKLLKASNAHQVRKSQDALLEVEHTPLEFSLASTCVTVIKLKVTSELIYISQDSPIL